MNYDEPAFPVNFANDTEWPMEDPFGRELPAGSNSQYVGLTKRDYFAIEIMKGLMSMERAATYIDEHTGQETGDGSGTLFIHTKLFSVEACMMADSLIQELGNV